MCAETTKIVQVGTFALMAAAFLHLLHRSKFDPGILGVSGLRQGKTL